MSRGSLRIGVTIGLRSEDESLWTNGIKQNALFLAKLFQNSPHRHAVTLVNTTAVGITPRLPWDLKAFPTAPFDQVADDLDILIELGGQIGREQTHRLKRSGARLISYCCGPEYIQNAEAMIFKRPLWDQIFINELYDEIWVIPQVVESSLYFFETLRRRPTRLAPFVWDPMCLVSASQAMPDGGEYRPGSDPKRLSVLEPNIDVMKFCLYPLLLAERAYRAAPDKISFLHVTNADHLVWDNREFAGLARTLDIVRANKAAFVGRFNTPDFLSEHTDIVISHQWGLALNYVYLEVCWQGYPLIHNAHICPDLGYYYPGNDINHGAKALVSALHTHDDSWLAYRDRQRERIGRFLTTNPSLAAEYDEMLFAMMAKPAIT